MPATFLIACLLGAQLQAELGRYLFYDTRLSINGTQSCATCHQQELAFTDGRATAIGATGAAHPRSAMSLVNVASSPTLTWSDPHPQTLEHQGLIPLLADHPVEMGLKGREAAVLQELGRDPTYRALRPLTMASIAKALAAFERTIVSARSPYDRYHRGNDPGAISEPAKRGEVLFFSDPVAGCFRCHGGPNFNEAAPGEPRFHNTALYLVYPAPNLGAYTYTKKPADAGKFKTPTLRNIALTAPYMHDGSIATLEEVLDHYAAGGRAHDNPNKDRRITGFALTRQNRADLLEFLRSLTDTELIRDSRFSNPWQPGLR